MKIIRNVPGAGCLFLFSPGLVGWLTSGRRLMGGCGKPTSRALCEGNEWYENMVMNLKPLVINHKRTWLFNFFRFQGKESTDCSGFCASIGPPTKQFCFWKKNWLMPWKKCLTEVSKSMASCRQPPFGVWHSSRLWSDGQKSSACVVSVQCLK